MFSRIYRYLQFKSTTGEKFQRHINIDTGYKYLTSSTILNSDVASGRRPYYNDIGEGDSVPYFRYLLKLQECLDDDHIGLTESEREILGKFIATIKVKAPGWMSLDSERFASRWSLCPLIEDDSTFSSLISSDSSRSILMVETPETGDMLAIEYADRQTRDGAGDDSDIPSEGEGGDGEDGHQEDGQHGEFTVTFLDEDGSVLRQAEVKENVHIPYFHIHSGNDWRRRFSHWRLISGHITSHMTVLSDIEL